ncbi:YIP1 family protein [Glaciecola sp. XM2]|jgi:hypothetical protein|uniref:YIP1 family protein n=1 Tax=Glaciecola sp. XM2 TaxID=1914931 RepID=UPI001BDF3AF8|nr:YIP1 family protein [Glaciecola sp. XM2]MBT1450943.1 YIP1 family protein [Glaciecola sp. XM2]
MQETSQVSASVTNPFQAVTEIFYRPRAVFDTIAVKDNWSWIPFFLVIAISIAPGYLYFSTVDFAWYANTTAMIALPDGSPAELEAISNTMEQGFMSMTTMISIPIAFVIVTAILGGYYTLCTRNDDKSVHGYTDWYGAMWWMLMPTLISSLLACVYLSLQTAGTPISQAAMAPLSLAFIFGIEMTDQWYGLLEAIRFDSLWTIALGAICLNSWTNFTMRKSIIIAALPSVLIWSITLLFVVL